jgi:hypothetical protein
MFTCSLLICVDLALCYAVFRAYRFVKTNGVKEEGICIRLCFKLGKTPAEDIRYLKKRLVIMPLAKTKPYESNVGLKFVRIQPL